jgi:hypothetical protein
MTMEEKIPHVIVGLLFLLFCCVLECVLVLWGGE